jgi:hypothetical protein
LVIVGLLSLIISSDYWIGRGANDWVQKGMHCELGARGGDGGGDGGGGGGESGRRESGVGNFSTCLQKTASREVYYVSFKSLFRYENKLIFQ